MNTPPDDMQGLLRRLDAIERNQSDQARQITANNGTFTTVNSRLDRIEKDHQDRRVEEARGEERAKSLVDDVASMKEDIASIKGTFAKALWVFVSAIILAFATFLIRGGLAP